MPQKMKALVEEVLEAAKGAGDTDVAEAARRVLDDDARGIPVKGSSDLEKVLDAVWRLI
jgi:hypothetical protein